MTRRDRFWMWLAWALPRELAYWAAVRVIAHATGGEYSSTVVPELSAMEALKRWEGARIAPTTNGGTP